MVDAVAQKLTCNAARSMRTIHTAAVVTMFDLGGGAAGDAARVAIVGNPGLNHAVIEALVHVAAVEVVWHSAIGDDILVGCEIAHNAAHILLA